MIDENTSQYKPDYAVVPGVVLADFISSLGMSQAELACRTGLAKKTVNEIIKGKAPITPETAIKLERTLGRPAHFWNNLERQFQEDKIRLEEQNRLSNHLSWLKKFPVNEMIANKWIREFKDNKVDQLNEVLSFFGVASPEQWKCVWNNYGATFRQSSQGEHSAEAISAWIRKGEIDAQEIKCQPFSRKSFLDSMNKIRQLTNEEKPFIFIRELTQICSHNGVAVVFVPPLKRTGVFGATRWIGDKAVIMLSLRYKTNDHLWFTFFHEAGHIVKHGKSDIFIDIKDQDENGKEEEANSFAQNQLIPQIEFRQFIGSGVYSREKIIEFSRKIGIAPGIVVGRLQREDRVQWNSTLNKLKVHYKWAI